MATFLSVTPTTELEAVNELLSAIGEAAVSTLLNASTIDVTSAINVLSRVNKEIQSEGWHFNEDYNVAFPLDLNGHINLGSTVLSAWSRTANTAVRGRKLYNRDDRTFVWANALTDGVTITLLEFEDLPETMRKYITVRAARKLQNEDIGEIAAEQINADEESRAKADAMAAESKMVKLNMKTGTMDMINTTMRSRNFRI